MNKKNTEKKYKLIFNPTAGRKRKIAGFFGNNTLDDVIKLFQQYQIPIDKEATRYPGHAGEIAERAVKAGYDVVLSAGGDGTIAEIAGSLVGTNTTLGILPMGTYMNIPRMLSVPVDDLEKAVAVIKIGRTRKIDAGEISTLSGKKLSKSKYFFENSGIGFDAEMQKHFGKLEKGNLFELIHLIKAIKDFYSYRAKIILDGKEEVETKASVITVSNGPFTGAALKVAPGAKLNDHLLTVSVYKMSRWGIFKYILRQKVKGQAYSSNLKRYKAGLVRIETQKPRLIHADGIFFGSTPVGYRIYPNALNVITGFPVVGDSHLEKKAPLDPK